MSYWTAAELARFGYFELEGVRSPGVLQEIDVGDGTPIKWDSQNGVALSGEFLRFMGLGLSEFSMKIRLVDDADRRAHDAAQWRRATAPPAQGQPDRKRSIRHPLLERARPAISIAVLLTSPIETPATSDGGGVSITYKFKAWRKPLPVPAAPKQPEAAAAPQPPQNPRQKAIADLTAQVNAELAKGTK